MNLPDDIAPISFEVVMKPLISGLINELARSIDIQDNLLTAVIPNFSDTHSPSNTITAIIKRNPFSTEIIVTDLESVSINGRPLTVIDDLCPLGFEEAQIKLLVENLRATDCLERIYLQSVSKHPKLLEKIGNIVGMEHISLIDLNEPAALARLFSILPQREAFILADSCGNIDGSTGNPLKNVMIYENSNIINYHPIYIAFNEGTSILPLIHYQGQNIESMGEIPDRLKQDLKFLQQSIIPLNQHSYNLIHNSEPSIESCGYVEAFTLLSKRSFIPVNGDYQIKTSFPGQITSEIRTINWSIMHDAIFSSYIVKQLAEKRLLPDNFWVQLTVYGAQANHDDRTTFCIREGLQDAICNENVRGVPKHLTPITSCVLTSRNIITPGKTLFESLVEFGFDGLELFKTITRNLIHTQLDLIKTGWIPDAHTQNMVYLFDFQAKKFAGLLMRDAESEKLNTEKLHSYGLELDSIQNVNPKLLRSLQYDDQKLNTLYLHHTIYTKHIIPMATLLHEKFHIDVDFISNYVKRCLVEWKSTNINADIEKHIDLSGRYYERNLACKTLSIGDPPHYRLITNHPLLPTNMS